MSKRPQDTSAEEPDGGNPHIRFRGGLRLGDRPGLLNLAVFPRFKMVSIIPGMLCAAPERTETRRGFELEPKRLPVALSK
jgi:hypothetical protein